MPAIQPQALRRGDRVAVVAPSSPVRARAELERGMKRVRGYGLRPVLGKHALEASGYLAGTDDERLADLQAAIDDPDVRGILCLRGGYGATRLLPRIDWSGLRDDPRPLLGYSDITALLAAMWKTIGLIGFHGPMVVTTESYAMGRECTALQRALLGDPGGPPKLPMDRGHDVQPRVLRPGTAEGPLVGGNLSLVQALLGTPWQIDTRGAIVFLEDIGEKPYRLDRMLTHLRQAGAFRDAAGVALGDFHLDDTPLASEQPDVVEVLNDRLGDLEIPVVHGLPFGHRPRSWTLPFGGRARLTAPRPGAGGRARLELLDAAVAARGG